MKAIDKALKKMKKEPSHRTMIWLPMNQWNALCKLKKKHGTPCNAIISVAIENMLKESA